MASVPPTREGAVQRLRRALEPAWRARALVTPFGRAVAGLAFVAWAVAWRLHWVEFGAVATGCVLAFAIASLFTLGHDDVAVTIAIDPARVVAGQTAGVRIEAANATGRRILPFHLEAPAGALIIQSDVPSLRIDGVHREEFAMPTSRRGVIRVGPVSSVRGDPLGLLRREVAWTDSTDLFVHPNTVPLSGIASGWIRDLDGLSTNDLSASDVELHTLREYEPGDDRRHVHWRTSVRVGTLMVRQFIDTRRWHLAVVLGTARRDYASDDEFELAVSVAASLGARAVRDRQSVSCVAGPHEVPALNETMLLDSLAGVELISTAQTVADTAIASRRYVRDASVVAVVTGSRTAVSVLRLTAQQFPVGMRVVSIRARLGSASSCRPTGVTTVLDVGRLDDLERLLHTAGGL